MLVAVHVSLLALAVVAVAVGALDYASGAVGLVVPAKKNITSSKNYSHF